MTHEEYLKTMHIASSALLEFTAKISDTYKPLYDAANTNARYTALQQVLSQIAETNSKMVQSILNSSDVYETISANMERMAKAASIDLTRLSSSGYYSKLGKSIMDIKIHDDFVSVPENIIPKDFQYEEVAAKSDSLETTENHSAKPSTKRLSHATAIALLAIIIPFLCWVISSIKEDIASKQEQVRHEETVALMEESNRLKAEENQIELKKLELLEQCLTYTCVTYEQIQESDSTHPDIDLSPSNTDFEFGDIQRYPATPDSASAASEESHPTEADGSENSERH